MFLGAHDGQPDGPLFLDLRVAADGSRTTTAQGQHGRWLNKVLPNRASNIAPAHSWRHRMQDELRRARVDPELMDAITGRHNLRNAGAGYGLGYRGMPDELLLELQKIPSPLEQSQPDNTHPVNEDGKQWCPNDPAHHQAGC